MTEETCSTCAAVALHFMRDRDKMVYTCADHARPTPVPGKEWQDIKEFDGLAHEIEKIAAEMERASVLKMKLEVTKTDED